MYPAVTQPFIDSVTACTWSSANGGCLLDSSGAPRFPSVTRTGWVLTSGGDTIGQGTASALHGARAQADGSFVATSGARYWLGDVGGAAVSEVWSPPPPKG